MKSLKFGKHANLSTATIFKASSATLTSFQHIEVISTASSFTPIANSLMHNELVVVCKMRFFKVRSAVLGTEVVSVGELSFSILPRIPLTITILKSK